MGFSQGLRRFTPPKKKIRYSNETCSKTLDVLESAKKIIDPKGVAGDFLNCNSSVPKRLVQELLLIWSMDIFLESCPLK